MPISFISEDITKVSADIIVNTANTELQNHGAGVCGAIFRASGQDQMQAACNRIGGCPAGEAVITEGFALPARYVIHTVGPRYTPGDPMQNKLLAQCYDNALTLARRHGRSVVFPLISTGKRGFPWKEALTIAVGAIIGHLNRYGNDLDVKLCLMDPQMLSFAQECKTAEEERLRSKNNEMSGMQFKIVKIRFYPEDEEKMKTMEHKEKMQYLKWLRENDRYVEVYDEAESG